MTYKTSDAYGDAQRLVERDERIQDSHDQVTPCQRCLANGIEAYYTSDMRHFSDKEKATEYQYQLLRVLK